MRPHGSEDLPKAVGKTCHMLNVAWDDVVLSMTGVTWGWDKVKRGGRETRGGLSISAGD